MTPTAPATAPAPGLEREHGRALATLVVAFSADPVIRWLYPGATRYLAHFPQLVRLLSAGAFEAGTIDLVSASAGAALWVPPDADTDDEALVELLVGSIEPPRHAATFAFLEQVQAHHPTERHWYLPFIGVDPRCQGRGLGSQLLREGLARCDQDHLPAYLEASCERNVPLYARHGFEVVGVIQADESPQMWPMWRPAR